MKIGVREPNSPVFFGRIEGWFKDQYIVYYWLSDRDYQEMARCPDIWKMETTIKALNLIPSQKTNSQKSHGDKI